ncbi:hypothetical protein CH373_01710 [Leptospira perolatii]|uniref:Uncharacterized protein n=1 Tax=Leptospira perolatii TaxID=2023191 RepID=A0A2M9ZRY2_9LEPT|nr:hypothetical protein [Leptospira perolatii]PJZ71251.1 hypothetical protein CH360_01710 [Leptospira perolatii]PJZ74784.1 hypothetical protein CH373_01710 [Leptospira perolatii]
MNPLTKLKQFLKYPIKLIIAYAIPIVLLIVCVFQLFVQPTFLDANDTATMDAMLDGSGKEPRSGFYFQGGAISQMLLTSDILKELKDASIPSDSQPEDTIDRMERVLLGQRIQILFYCFLILLSLSSIASLKFRAYFYSFMNRVLYVFGLIYGISVLTALFGALGRSPDSMTWVFPGILICLAWIVLLVNFAIRIGELFKKEEANRFHTLHNLEEDEAEFRTGKKAESESLIDGILHFLGILFLGILIGNLVYIPLFLLQKNYASQFGALLLGAILVLSGFYVRNYLRLGKSSELGKTENLILGLSYLQLRFVRNFLFGTIGFLLVLVFIVLIFWILLMNIWSLESLFPFIEGGQHL